MRILLFGDWSDTGFGVVTRELSRRFLDAGNDVRVIARNHRGEPIQGPMSGRVWPGRIQGNDHGGNISQEAMIGKFWAEYDTKDFWVPDVAMMIADAGTLAGFVGPHRTELFQDRLGPFGVIAPTFNYVPIEGDNINKSWRDVWQRIKPVSMSRFGQKLISDLMGYEVPMIYHGVDTDTFHPAAPNTPIRVGPLTLTSKEACKKGANIDPNRIMILRTDRLVERKQYNVFFDVMARVMAQDDRVDVILHTHPIQPPWNMYEEIARYVPPEFIPRFRLTGAHDTWYGLDANALAALYNAADLYVSPTAGEGFGLTLAESLACEVPVVTTDYAAGPEVMAPGGVAVPPLHDVYGNVVKIHSSYGMDWAQPDPTATTDAIMRLLAKPALRRNLGKTGRMHVVKNLNWDKAATEFIALFANALVDHAKEQPDASPPDNG